MRPVRKIKTKYYSKEILQYILVAGVLTISGGGIAIGYQIIQKMYGNESRAPRKKSHDAFQYLKKKGLIEVQREGNDVRIALTKEGRSRAGKYQVDDLFIERPKKWDGKWRIIIFDIPAASNTIRDIFRRKLKEFGFYRLQKSIWVFPFECREEIELLREFLGADKRQITFIEAAEIEGDSFLRKHFQI